VKLTIRPYQRRALDSISKCLAADGSTLLVAATGTGKTFMLSHAIKENCPGGKRVMVLAHREELITQNAKAIERVLGEPCDIERAGMHADLPGTLRAKAKVIVASKDSLHARRISRFNPSEFGLIVTDEAHHAPSQSYQSIYDYFTGVPHLGVTATPDRHDEEALGQVYKSVAMVYDIADAIHDGYLVPVKARTVIVEGLNLNLISTTAGDLNQGELAAQLEAERPMHEVAASITREIGTRRAIIFTVSVRQAERLSEILNDYQPNSSRWICGATPEDRRKADLAAHRSGECRYMVNVGVLTEGYDDPGVSMIVMARPTKSRSLFAQCLGRGTRPMAASIDGIADADGRKAAIAASVKPDCIAEGQYVATDCGFVPIERVTTDMKVWDGVDFVSHCGIVFHGEQKVITYAGLTATPDHKVWTAKGWQTLGQCAAEQTPIACGEVAGLPVREIDGHFRRDRQENEGRPSACYCEMLGLPVGDGSGLQQRGHSEDCGMPSMWQSPKCSEVAGDASDISQRKMHQCIKSGIQVLRSTGNRVQIHRTNGDGDVGGKESRAETGSSTGSHRQQRPLRAGQSAVGESSGANAQHSQAGAIQETSRVYDILNAGPRHRFVVEGLIVSNCLVLDFTGNCGRHKLASPADVLGGRYTQEERDAAAAEAQTEGVDVTEALERARHKTEEAMNTPDILDYAKSRQRILALAKYVMKEEDLFDGAFTPGRERAWMSGRAATPSQIATMEKFGYDPADSSRLSRDECSKIIGASIMRVHQKKATAKQAALLTRFGVQNAADVSFSEASRIIGERMQRFRSTR
jgi:superfamily II DNA or RNA helicase